MLTARHNDVPSVRATIVVVFLSLAGFTGEALAQFSNPLGGGSSTRNLMGPKKGTAREFYRENGPIYEMSNEPPVAEVRIEGVRAAAKSKVRSYIRTRPGRPFDPDLIQEDVRRLMSTRMFHDVRTYDQQTANGVVVMFEVIERPTIQYVKFLGNRKLKDRVLKKEAALEVGASLNLYTVDEAREKLEQFYRDRGFPKATIDVAEGNRSEDRGVVFIVNEGTLQRVLRTDFVGAKFVSDRRLKTQIESKRGYMWLFKGRFDRAKLDEDVEKLTAYYRGFGFFRARIGREYSVSGSGKWVSVTFVIDEGPRYGIRNVRFIGNTKFEERDLVGALELNSGDFFTLAHLNKDVAMMKEIYGRYGFIFADIEAEPRFLEEPGQLDLIYNVKEGEVVRVRNINVKVSGDYPHTRTSVVMARGGDIQPGDVIDIRKMRDWERRLRASQLFENNPAQGVSPRVVVRPIDDAARN